MKYDKYEKNGAYHFDWYDDPNWAWYKKCVDRIVDFCHGSTIDAGCGDGLVLSKLRGISIGLDNEQSALEICKSKGLEATYCDLEDIKPITIHEGYDYVCSLNTLEHLKTPEMIKRLVRGANRGAIIITDKATSEPGRYHEHEYTLYELMETFKEFDPKPFEIRSTEFGKPISFIGVEIKK